MVLNNFSIKNKFTNHIMINGKKQSSEKILLNSCKNIQKFSKKQSKKILQLCLIYSTPIFKLHKSSNKKIKKRNRKIRITPTFISNNLIRISLGIKFILLNIKKKKINQSFFQKLYQEILLITKTKGILLENKNEAQKQTLLNKKYFKYYRW